MDTITQFLLTEKFDATWAVMGNPATGEHILIPVDDRPADAVLNPAEDMKVRLGGMTFAGCFGYRTKDHFCDARAENAPGSWVVMAAAIGTFAAVLAEHMEGVKTKDAVSWLENLHQLEDTRDFPGMAE